MKKHFFYKHPVMGGILSMLIAAFICYACSIFVSALCVLPLKGLLLTIPKDKLVQVVTIIQQMMTIVLAFICLWIFHRRNHKNGYHGAMKIRGEGCNDVWICISILALVMIVRFLFGAMSTPGGFQNFSISISSIMLSIYAGVTEEIVTRGIPAAVMMRNRPDSKRIHNVVIITALLFGILHIANMIAGYTGATAGLQAIFALLMGVFLVAIYLRTGSITVTIIIHILYDMIATSMILPGTAGAVNIAFIFVSELLPLVLALILLRKTKHAEILEKWAGIWTEEC